MTPPKLKPSSRRGISLAAEKMVERWWRDDAPDCAGDIVRFAQKEARKARREALREFKPKANQIGWVIEGPRGIGFYTGWWLTRRNAIKDHCEALGKDWAHCKESGDRVVKVQILALSKKERAGGGKK